MYRRVRCDSIKYVEFIKWVDQKCTGIHESLLRVKNFKCKNCLQKDCEKKVNLDGDIPTVVDRFGYLNDGLCTDGRSHNLVVFTNSKCLGFCVEGGYLTGCIAE